MNQQIMDMAQAEFNRAVLNNLGIYMIAEAWGIEPRQVVRHKDGYGLLARSSPPPQIARPKKWAPLCGAHDNRPASAWAITRCGG